MLPLLELLFNLSSEDPTAITLWLVGSAPNWSPWGALRGLELSMNHRDEQVRERHEACVVPERPHLSSKPA